MKNNNKNIIPLPGLEPGTFLRRPEIQIYCATADSVIRGASNLFIHLFVHWDRGLIKDLFGSVVLIMLFIFFENMYG